MIAAVEALHRLIEGNRRFVSGHRSDEVAANRTRLDELVEGQNPSAVILGCSDSRVPAEIIFDQGPGDLFVVRVAGNIAAPSQVGSVEYAVEQLGTRLVVVLGHSGCGAVLATIQTLQRPEEAQSPNLLSIVDRIRPTVKALRGPDDLQDSDAFVRRVIRANVCASANHLRYRSPTLERRIQADGLVIVGAEYALETGVVDFFDGMPEGV